MNEITVVKFGGSSLADSKQFKKVKDVITADTNRKYVVPSAPGRRFKDDHKVTDLLLMCYQLASHGLNFDEVFSLIENRYNEIASGLNLDLDLAGELATIKQNIQNGASSDYTASRGEYLNGKLLAAYLDFEFIDATEVILFDDEGRFQALKSEILISTKLGQADYAVIPGFYGANEEGDIVTFSRGGSDVTGSLIANGVQADLYENWTDVAGFLVADPNIVDDAIPMDVVTYKELRELSYMGAPVLHEEAIFPVKKHGIPINVRDTNAPEKPGTMIVDDSTPIQSKGSITGISGKQDFTVIAVEKTMMATERDFFRKLISVFETNDIAIEHMPSSIDSISIVVQTSEITHKLKKVIEEIRIFCNPDNIETYPNMSLIAVVGRGMIRTKGIAAKIFTALEKSNVNLRMIIQGSSELNIIVGVENQDFEKAIAAIYHAFY